MTVLNLQYKQLQHFHTTFRAATQSSRIPKRSMRGAQLPW